ncbi:hypothetical protein BT67DRAFT_254395 [Trichocladium antarcticum]|uniref:Serine-threonine rich protein n=1 Tax=Trichocladium antarcticum TaxID=1450529 RepID=A0AAN6UN15_9PEZI|nr:hypothetical protein BT67DRAFT_254395 [Trichocladium antarcticum]
MKFSATAAMALGMAPLALGKTVHNLAPVRRDGHLKQQDSTSVNSVQASDDQIAELAKLFGLNKGSGISVNFLWINLGGGAATTVVGTASTVTVTQTVGGGAAATQPPGAVVTDEAGTATEGAPATGTVAGAGATHSVTVGGPQGLSFNPQELSAAIGDTVIFSFLSQNHTATQSGFDTPCKALDGGMDSGFQANPNNTIEPAPQVAMQVMVDTPLWFYCRQGNHCGKGMVFSINPSAEKTHAQFQANAIEQEGDGAGGAITGDGPAGDANAGAGADAGASASASASASDAATPAETAVATSTGAASGSASTGGVVVGSGQIGVGGSCVCAVQCSFGASANVGVQGRDSFGGYGGEMPFPGPL